MKPYLMVLSGMLVLALACGEERTDGRDTEAGVAGAGIEHTTAAPSTDLGTPPTDTAADTGAGAR